MTPRRPIVDIAAKPSRWKRFVAWCWASLPPPTPYQPIPCENELARTIQKVLVAVIVVCLIIAWVFWPRSP